MTNQNPAPKKEPFPKQEKAEPSCLFNIIMYVDAGKNVKELQEFLDLLKKNFPCRSIFIIEEQGSQENLTTSINGVPGTKPKNLNDQITLQVSPKAKERIPFLIYSYILSDLPTYVFWMQDLSRENPILIQLERIATKIVFDPSTAKKIKEYSRTVLSHKESGRCAITDIAWFSIAGWREVFASIFHSSKKIDQLFHAKIIRIRYNRLKTEETKRQEMKAFYFQAWLGAQLNWKIHDIEEIEGNIRISYPRFIHDTVVLLVPEENPELLPGAIIAVDIESSDGSHSIIKRVPGMNQVKVWLSSADQCDIPYTHLLPQPTREQLVINELFWRGTSEHYENTLRLIYQIHWNE